MTHSRRPRQPLTREQLTERREREHLVEELRRVREVIEDNRAALKALLRLKSKARVSP